MRPVRPADYSALQGRMIRRSLEAARAPIATPRRSRSTDPYRRTSAEDRRYLLWRLDLEAAKLTIKQAKGTYCDVCGDTACRNTDACPF
jgi:hypothetical protein